MKDQILREKKTHMFHSINRYSTLNDAMHEGMGRKMMFFRFELLMKYRLAHTGGNGVFKPNVAEKVEMELSRQMLLNMWS